MNDHKYLDKLLQRYPGLSDHLDEKCRNLLLKARPVSFEAGTMLFREADPCLDFIWLIDGAVRVYKHSEDGREVTLYRVNAGELCILGINNLLHGRPCAAEARCDEPVSGLLISGPDFLNAIDTSPGFRRYVMGTLSSRLDEITRLVSDVVFRRLDLRMACLLGQMFERSRGRPIEVTHEALAREVGTSREVVSRILKEFERQQCILLSRGCIHLTSAQGLAWFK
ncbi:MAG: Crp/Fnr family transcriptional regulator [Gammaproteobacteria bacterium]|nr:Crp/Fnr family transcriptional regulator [Gammaproteobacteria bacterium]